jgi:nitrogen fixation NifU-like protein
MMDELRELYQEVILDHGRSPRNFRRPEHPSCKAHGRNPMCGDALTVFLNLDQEGTITDAAFEGKGCAISVASASIMTEVLKGKSAAEADALFHAFHRLCTTGEEPADGDQDIDKDALDHLRVLAGVRGFPIRVKCATLAWHTMKAAVDGNSAATTE